MANEIDALLGGGMTPNNTETAAMAAALRGQLNEGSALGTSTIGGVSDFGKSQATAAREGAREAGRLKKALEKEAREKSEEESRFKRGQESQIAQEERALKRWREQQTTETDDAAKLARLKSELTKGNNGIKPSATAVKDYIQTGRVLENIGAIDNIAKTFDDKDLSQVDQPATEAATDMLLPSTAERYVQDTYLYNRPKVKAFRSSMANMEAEIRKILSGTQVTGYELKDIQKWSPSATGISLNTRMTRMEKIKNDWNRFKEAQERMYDFGDYNNNAGTGQSKTVTMAELQAMGATPEQAAAEGYEVVE